MAELHFELVTPDKVAEAVPCGPDPDRFVEAIKPFARRTLRPPPGVRVRSFARSAGIDATQVLRFDGNTPPQPPLDRAAASAW